MMWCSSACAASGSLKLSPHSVHRLVKGPVIRPAVTASSTAFTYDSTSDTRSGEVMYSVTRRLRIIAHPFVVVATQPTRRPGTPARVRAVEFGELVIPGPVLIANRDPHCLFGRVT